MQFRLGKFMEDMDLLAGAIAYKHCRNICNISNPVTIVTASVDKIQFIKSPSIDFDIRLHGNVVHVGKSSMQVLIKMEQIGNNESILLAEAKFTMVARDKNHEALNVPQLVSVNEEEKSLMLMGEKERLKRINARAISTEKIPPSTEESIRIHDIFLFAKDKSELPADYVWMSDTLLSSTRICHPQVHFKLTISRSETFIIFCLVDI